VRERRFPPILLLSQRFVYRQLMYGVVDPRGRRGAAGPRHRLGQAGADGPRLGSTGVRRACFQAGRRKVATQALPA
jgi:hypothetical protein